MTTAKQTGSLVLARANVPSVGSFDRNIFYPLFLLLNASIVI